MLTLQIVIILLLMLLNGLFAMAELSLISARKARLQQAAERGSAGAQVALDLKEDPARLLSTVQIGITVTAILTGTFGGATLGESLAEYLADVPGIIGKYAHAISISAVVIVISYLSLVLGELVPKRVALANPEPLAIALSRLMRAVSRVAAPAEWLLSASTNLVLRLLPAGAQKEAPVTEDEINLMLREGAAAGQFHAGETAIVQMALRLGDRRVGAVMTPRPQVEWIDATEGEEELRKKVLGTPHSRFPVFEGGPDKVLGILQVKDVLATALAGQKVDLRAAVRPALFLPNTVTALRALEMFKKSGDPMAIVVDEYGDFEGIVTLNDVMQALVGDIASPGEETDPAFVQREDGSWLIDGMVATDEVKDVVGLSRLPGEEEGDFHTLGGFMMARVHRVPKVGDHFDINGFRFEVVVMDGRRVDRVLVVPPAREGGSVGSAA
jgi:putative hemolysin